MRASTRATRRIEMCKPKIVVRETHFVYLMPPEMETIQSDLLLIREPYKPCSRHLFLSELAALAVVVTDKAKRPLETQENIEHRV